MTSPVAEVLLYALAPSLAMAVGGSFAAFRQPSPRLCSYFQHFAAGVVFAALGTEIVPQVVHERAPAAAVLGFATGVALMLGIRWWTTPAAPTNVGAISPSSDELAVENPNRLIAIVAIDLVVDGLLIGIGFVANAQTGLLLTMALGVEVLFLGLSTAVAMGQGKCSRTRIIGTSVGLCLLLPTSAATGAALLGGLHGAGLEVALSFGAASLLFLVTEELLVEAHEVPETTASTAMFFAGFLVLLILHMLSQEGSIASSYRGAVGEETRAARFPTETHQRNEI